MSSCEYGKQMAPTCNKWMNFTAHFRDIQLILYCIAAVPEIIGVQIAAFKPEQPNLG